MIALAALLSQGTPSEAALAAHPEPDAALALLQGRRPRRLAAPATLMAWSAKATGTPDALLAACLSASGDTAEVAALLLPPAADTPPGLSECLTTLDALAAAPVDQRRSGYLALAQSLPPAARLLFTRLAAGTFRQRLKPAQTATDGPREFLAILTMLSQQGPEATFALRHGNGLVPIATLPLTLPETQDILAWARTHVLDRFGPKLLLQPDLVFRLTCEGTTPNPRRKSKRDLTAPRLMAWLREAAPDQATTLNDFSSSALITVDQILHGGPGV
jgi:hypothetical protein